MVDDGLKKASTQGDNSSQCVADSYISDWCSWKYLCVFVDSSTSRIAHSD